HGPSRGSTRDTARSFGTRTARVHSAGIAYTRAPCTSACVAASRSEPSLPFPHLCPSTRSRHLLLITPEREPERAQERSPFIVGLRRRDDRDVHPANRVDLVVVDLR